jgi:UDP-N-acetylglucosamine:LPS N-acetylglucosamine transferase
MGVPLVLDFVHTMPQERPNADFVEQHGLGLRVADRGQMFKAVQSLADDPARLAGIRSRIKAYRVPNAAPTLIKAIQRCL